MNNLWEDFLLMRKPSKKRKVPYGHISNYWCIFDGLMKSYHTKSSYVSARSQFKMLNQVLGGWQERRLLGSYDEDELTFYDGIIGYVIRNAHYFLKEYETGLVERHPKLDVFDIWKYQGIICRVMDVLPDDIIYHNKISSWTKSVDSFYKMNNLCKTEKYTFLIANTNDMYGFDVNNYNDYFNQGNQHIQHEEEVIFPMDKKYIIDVFYGTLDEFKAHVKRLNLIDKND